MATRTCPRCRLISEVASTACDCGYTFATGRTAPRVSTPARSEAPGALTIAEDYRALVRIVLLQAGIGVGTRLAAIAARRAESDALLLAVNLVGLAMLLTLAVLIAQRTSRVAVAMGSASARGWAVAVGTLGIFGLLAFQSQGRTWSERQGIQFGFFGPDPNDARRVDRDRHPGSAQPPDKALVRDGMVYGGLWRRILALAFDIVVALLMAFAFFVAAGFLSDPVGVAGYFTPILEGFWGTALGVVVYGVFEGSRLRGTPGKWIAGIAVEDARAEGEGASFLQGLWRNVAKHVSGLLFPVSLLMAGLTRRKRTPHDFMAGTVVVRRKREGHEMTVCASTFATCAVVYLVSIVVWQHEGRPGVDRARIGATTRRGFPMTLKSLPSVSAEALFEVTHAKCFAEHYRKDWAGNTLDRPQYLGCMDAAYAARFAETVVLEGVDFEPHVVDGESDPRWTKAVIRGRVTEGELGGSLVLHRETRCDGEGEGYSSSDTPLDGSDLVLETGGAFRFSTLSGIQAKPCRWTLYLMLGRTPYGKRLTVDLPLADPVRIAEQEERHRAYLAALAEAKSCRARTASSLASLGAAEMSSELRALTKDLSSSDRTVAGQAMAESVKLGAAARSVIPALLPKLEDRGYEGQSAARALASLDPEGTAVVPILLCQLGEPDPQWKYAAAGALLRVGNRQGLDALAGGLKNESGHHRLAAMLEVEKAGRKASPLLPLLIQCGQSRPEPRERGECLNLLPRVDPADRNALRALEAAAQNDEDAAVRDRAKSAMQYAGELRYRDAAKSPDAAARCLASDPLADLRLRCLYAATSPRPFGTAAAAALKKAAKDPDPRVREAAKQVLANPY